MDRRQSAVLSCSWAVRPPDWPYGLPRTCRVRSELAGAAALDVLFGVSLSVPVAFSPAVGSELSLVLLFSFSFSPSLLLRSSFFRLPSILLSQKANEIRCGAW